MRDLRQQLARLFGDERLARMLAADAGLDVARIDFRGGAELAWQSLLEEATRAGRIADVVRVARERYPRDEVLRRHDTSGGERAVTPRPARSLSLKERQGLVRRLARQCDPKIAREMARRLGLTVPMGRNAGGCWVTVVQEIHLRDLDAAPLLALCPEEE